MRAHAFPQGSQFFHPPVRGGRTSFHLNEPGFGYATDGNENIFATTGKLNKLAKTGLRFAQGSNHVTNVVSI